MVKIWLSGIRIKNEKVIKETRSKLARKCNTKGEVNGSNLVKENYHSNEHEENLSRRRCGGKNCRSHNLGSEMRLVHFFYSSTITRRKANKIEKIKMGKGFGWGVERKTLLNL